MTFRFPHLMASLLLLATPTWAFAKKTPEDHWRETGLTLDWARQEILTDDACEESENAFFGCIEALQTALRYAKPPMVIAPLTLLNDSTSFEAPKTILGSFGVAVAKPDSTASAQEALNTAKKFSKDRYTAIKALYRTHKQGNHVLSWDEGMQTIRNEVVSAFPAKEAQVTGALVNGYLSGAADPHTYVIPTAILEEQNGSTELIGIGIRVSAHPEGIAIVKPLEGGPAFAAGVRSKDIITHIDNKPLLDLPTDQRIGLITGLEGTSLTLTIKRKEQIVSITLKRAKITEQNVTTKLLTDSSKAVGYIKLNTFLNKDSCEVIQRGLRQLRSDGAEAYIVDLRGNGGGYLDQGVCLSGLFLPRGSKVVEQRDIKSNQSLIVSKTTSAPVTTLPLVVLVDASSASASELTAGALQDYQRAWIVGVTTYGKGTVQTVKKVSAKLSLAATSARFHRPSGLTNQIVGITPDIEVFATPHPTDDDKVFEREADSYPNPVSPNGQPWTQTRPVEQQQLAACIQTQGVAERVWNERQGDQIQPDYQLLVAQDAASCARTQ